MPVIHLSTYADPWPWLEGSEIGSLRLWLEAAASAHLCACINCRYHASSFFCLILSTYIIQKLHKIVFLVYSVIGTFVCFTFVLLFLPLILLEASEIDVCFKSTIFNWKCQLFVKLCCYFPLFSCHLVLFLHFRKFLLSLHSLFLFFLPASQILVIP